MTKEAAKSLEPLTSSSFCYWRPGIRSTSLWFIAHFCIQFSSDWLMDTATRIFTEHPPSVGGPFTHPSSAGGFANMHAFHSPYSTAFASSLAAAIPTSLAAAASFSAGFHRDFVRGSPTAGGQGLVAVGSQPFSGVEGMLAGGRGVMIHAGHSPGSHASKSPGAGKTFFYFH